MWLVTALAATALVTSGAAASAGAASSDEVDPAVDNPPGCVTARSEDDPQCGAQGREHFPNPQHKPPIEACADQRSPLGSRITRVRPLGPVHPDGSLAFIPGVCVYLPPGYDGGTLRYPVLYLLHGGGGDQGNWVTMGKVQETLDAAFLEDTSKALIVVMPDGRSGQWYDYRDGSFLIESYVLDHVVPFVDNRFRTIADRRGRAIDGLSNGGYGALHLAAKAPDLFVVAGAMSANVGARSFGGLGTPVFPGGPTLQEAGAWYYGSVPAELASNLDHVDLTIDWGATCRSDISVDLCATWAFEQAFRLDNQHFRDRLEETGYRGTYEYRETEGSHAWRWWSAWLRDRHLPFFWERLADPEFAYGRPAASPTPDWFRYRSIFPRFSVFGYDVETQRPALEFLDLDAVTAGGLTVRGSGGVTITTAPRYKPGGRYRITGAGGAPSVAKADGHGRLRFSVDLGPAHQYEQYSPPARAAELLPGYWTERAVRITALR